MPNNYGGYFGAFAPTTNVWDTTELEKVEVTKPEFKELLIRLYQNLNLMSEVLNIKDSGYYYETEFVNGQQFFPNPILNSGTSTGPTPRQVFRMTIDFGALPNAGTAVVAHGIPVNSATTVTRIYGAASDTTNLKYIPIPYSSASNDNIELYADSTNVYIITNSASWITYTTTYVIIEYLKQ